MSVLPIVIATSRTHDDKTVKLWNDGTITWTFESIRGIGTARTEETRKKDLVAGLLFIGEATLFDAVEVPIAYRALRKAVRQNKVRDPGDARRVMTVALARAAQSLSPQGAASP